MKRTRKWAFVAQEAQRLAGLGVAPVDIAQRIGVKRSTVQRWMAAGKLTDTRQGARVARAPRVTKVLKPGEWASSVRKDYQLDATDEQLVVQADIALSMSLDPHRSDTTRLQAMGRYQAIVKQLALVTRTPEAEKAQPSVEPAKAAAARPALRRPSVDPRNVLKAVK